MFGMVAYRCRACRNRFHIRPPKEASETEPEEHSVDPPDETPDKDAR